MDLGIAGKIALVTGSSKGIGLAVARGLAAEGARLVMSARGEAALAEAVEQVRLAGGEALAVAADVRHRESIEHLLEQTRQRFGDPDILVVNAGGPPPGVPTALGEEDWFSGFQLTLMSAVRLVGEVTAAMKERGWGRIINITSVSVKEPIINLTLSNAFRAAVTGFAKTLSTELAPFGITVNNVAPGYTATERLEELFQNEAARQALISSIPSGRFADPAEIAAAAAFLASRQASYLTGQTLVVDGGALGVVF